MGRTRFLEVLEVSRGQGGQGFMMDWMGIGGGRDDTLVSGLSK